MWNLSKHDTIVRVRQTRKRKTMLKEVTVTKVGLPLPHLAERLSKTNQTILSMDNWSQQSFESGVFRKQDRKFSALGKVFLFHSVANHSTTILRLVCYMVSVLATTYLLNVII